MTIQHIFKSSVPSIRYVFKDGKHAHFIDYRFITDVDSEIKELTAEVGEEGRHKSKHPFIYIDSDEKEVDSEAPTALQVIEQKAYEKAIAAVRAEMAATQGDLQAAAVANRLGGIGSTETFKALEPLQRQEVQDTVAAGLADSGTSNVGTTTTIPAATLVTTAADTKPTATLAPIVAKK